MPSHKQNRAQPLHLHFRGTLPRSKFRTAKPEDIPKGLNILFVDDHEWVRVGLGMLIKSKTRHRIIGEAKTGVEAVEQAKKLRPDIILMDIELPEMDGITATRIIKSEFPDMKVIMFTSHKGEEDIAGALSSSANAYCMKDIKIERLTQVLDMVADGATWFDPGIKDLLTQILLRNMREDKTPVEPEPEQFFQPTLRGELTDREMDVLELIVRGKSNKEIAMALNITLSTVKIHVGRVIEKLAVEDRTQAAIKALQQRLVRM